MKKEKIIGDNVAFFMAAVGLSFGTEFFAQTVLESSLEMS